MVSSEAAKPVRDMRVNMLCGCVIDVNGMNGAHVADGWAGDDKRRAHNSLINPVVVAGVVINM